MIFLSIGSAIAFFALGLFAAAILVLNRGSAEMVEILLPSLGALLIAGFYLFKHLYVERPQPQKISFKMVNIEYEKGYTLPLQNLFSAHLSELRSVQPYINYLSEWREAVAAITNPEFQEKKETLSTSDQTFFQLAEWLVLKALTKKFGRGWDFDQSNLSSIPFGGESGSMTVTTPSEFVDKINLRNLLYIRDTNEFIASDSSTPFQLAVPRGSKVNINRTSSGFFLSIDTCRFKFSMSFSMKNGLFFPTIRQDDLSFGLFQALHAQLGNLNPGKNIEDIRERIFEFAFYFEQNPLLRFSEQAKFDKTFGENLTAYFKTNYAWDSVSAVIEGVAGNH